MPSQTRRNKLSQQFTAFILLHSLCHLIFLDASPIQLKLKVSTELEQKKATCIANKVRLNKVEKLDFRIKRKKLIVSLILEKFNFFSN